MTSNSIIFSLEASLVDLNNNVTPNFDRSTLVFLEREVDGSVQIYPIEAHCPAFYSEDGAFLLEPAAINLITWPLALNQNVWIKGSTSVIVQPDEATAPDTSYLADRVVWSPGRGNIQKLSRTVALDAGKEYTLSAFLRAKSPFAPTDQIRITGDVIGKPVIGLAVLNNYLNRYRYDELTLTFRTSGQEPKLPANHHQTPDYAVTAVGTNTITISTTNAAIVVNDLAGGQVFFNNVSGRFFKVVSNTAYANGAVTVTLDATNLAAEGVNTTSRAILSAAPKQTITIEVYCESAAALDWGGIQLEEGPFRTSFIYQEGELRVRAGTLLSYRRSPIAALRTFGVFAELKFWRGDGNLCDFGNFKMWIAEGKLYVQAGGATINSPDTLPSTGVKFFAQISEGSSSLSLYVNGVLKARTAITGFTADPDASLTLTSGGVRAFQRFLCTDQLLLDGQPTVGGAAGGEVAEMFNDVLLIDATSISAHAPLIKLPPVTVPAPTPPIARSRITGVNVATNTITVLDGTGYVINQPVAAVRGSGSGRLIITRATVTNISGNNLVLNNIAGIVIDDFLVYGNVDTPGRASVRFPFDPIDQQFISAIDVATKRLTVSGSTAFNRERAFITTVQYQDIAEVLIRDLDPINNYLFVDNVTGILPGHIIQQPLNELILPPSDYMALLLEQVNDLRIAQRWSNGLVLENSNAVPVLAQPAIRIYL